MFSLPVAEDPPVSPPPLSPSLSARITGAIQPVFLRP